MSATDRDQLRKQVDSHLSAGEWVEARGALERLWNGHASAALAGYVGMRFDRLREHLPFHPCRVAILRSFTVEPIVPMLRAAAWVNRVEVTAKVGEFNAYAQEALDPESWLYGFDADAIVLAVQTQDVAPELWDGFADRSAAEIRATVERVLQDYRTWLRTLRSRTQAYVLVHSLEAPARPSRGILDAQSGDSQAEAVAEIN